MLQFAGAADFKTVSGTEPNKEPKNGPAHGDERGFCTSTSKRSPASHRHL